MAYKYQDKPPKYNKLYLDKKNAKWSGVCAGLADYTGLDAGVVRILTVLSFFLVAGLPSIIAYVIMAWVLDPKPEDLFESKEEDEFWKDVRTKPKATIRDVRHKFREIERRLRSAEAHVTSKEYNLKREFRDLEK
jgi:phage shock protein C